MRTLHTLSHFSLSCLCLLLTLLVPSSAQEQKQTYYEVPFITEDTANNGVPFAYASINRQPQKLFSIDTGSQNCLIDANYARTLPFIIEKDKASGFEYFTCELTLDKTRLPLEGARFYLTDLSTMRRQKPDFVGIISIEVLQIFAVSFNYETKIMGLYYPGNVGISDSANRGIVRIPMIPTRYRYSVTATLDGQTAPFLLDTGSSQTTVTRKLQQKLPKPVSELFGGEAISVANGGKSFTAKPTVLQRYKSLAVGEIKWNDPIVSMHKVEGDVPLNENLLGADFFQRYSTIFDFPAKILYVLPDTARSKTRETLISTGLIFSLDLGKGLFVDGTYSPSPASKAGIEAGWKVLKYQNITIDRKSATLETMATIRAMDKSADQSISVELETKKGKKISLVLKTTELLP